MRLPFRRREEPPVPPSGYVTRVRNVDLPDGTVVRYVEVVLKSGGRAPHVGQRFVGILRGD